MKRSPHLIMTVILAWLLLPTLSHGWFDETHVAIAKAAGYSNWFNACGPDMIRVKMGSQEGHNLSSIIRIPHKD